MRTMLASLLPSTRSAAFAATVLALAAASAMAQNRGMAHNVGDTESTAIQPVNDQDTFLLNAAAGSALSVTVKAAKGVSLLPTLVVLRPDGSEASAGEMAAAKYAVGKSSVKVANFPIDVTGRWALRVSNLGPGQSGAYTLQTKVKFPKPLKLKGVTLPQGGSLDTIFPMQAECELTMSFKRKAGGIDWNAAQIGLFQPSGAAVPVSTNVWVVTTKGMTAKAVSIATPFGDYRLRLPGPQTGGDTVGDLQLKVKWPKRKGVLRTRSSAEPAITTVLPNSGNFGTSMQVNGLNFETGAVFLVGTTQASSIVRNIQGTQLTGTAPSGTGTVDVLVINPDGQEGSLEDAFTYLPPPTFSSITPNHGPATGGTPVTITGTNFRAGMKVFFGAFQTQATVTVVNSTTITLTTDARASGLYSVEVRDPSGASATLPGAFRFDRVLTPVSGAFAGNLGDTVLTTVGILGDIDGDGLIADDLVLSVESAPSDGAGGYLAATRVFRGNNNRTFTELTNTSFPSVFFTNIPSSLGTGISRVDFAQAQNMAMGDLDGDGDRDLVLGVNGSFATTSAILYFQCPVNGTSIPSTNPYNPYGYYYLSYPGTRVFRNSGNGSFQNTTVEADAVSGAISMAMPVLAQGIVDGEFFQSSALALGDVDGDQDLDLLLTTTGAFPAAQLYIQYSGTTPVGCGVTNFLSSAFRVLANDGNGRFRFAPALNLVGGTATESMQGVAMAVGDVDGDNDIDAIVSMVADEGLSGAELFLTRLALNGGTGSFAKAPGLLPYPTALDDGRASTVILHDLNGNGSLDLILSTTAFLEVDDGEGNVTRKSSTRILLNSGAGVFTDVTAAAMPPVDIIERWDASGVAVGDIDGDGDQDLVLSVDTYIYDYAYLQDFVPATRVLLNGGNGSFTRAPTGFLPGVDLGGPTYLKPEFLHARKVFLGDLDNDGDRDMVLASRNPPEDVPVPGAASPALRVIENR